MPTALKISTPWQPYFRIVCLKRQLDTKCDSRSTRMHGTNDHKESEILKTKLRRARPLRPGWGDIAAGKRAADRPKQTYSQWLCAHDSLQERELSSAWPLLLPNRRAKHSASHHVISASWMFVRSAGSSGVVCNGAILDVSNWLAGHLKGLPVMTRLIRWYVLHAQNKFGRGEIWVHLAFKKLWGFTNVSSFYVIFCILLWIAVGLVKPFIRGSIKSPRFERSIPLHATAGGEH